MPFWFLWLIETKLFMQVYARVVYAGICNFGFYDKLKLKKNGLCKLMQKWFMHGYAILFFYCKLKLKKVVLCRVLQFWFLL